MPFHMCLNVCLAQGTTRHTLSRRWPYLQLKQSEVRSMSVDAAFDHHAVLSPSGRLGTECGWEMLCPESREVSCSRSDCAYWWPFMFLSSEQSIPLNGGLSRLSRAYAQDDCHAGFTRLHSVRGFMELERGLLVEGFESWFTAGLTMH